MAITKLTNTQIQALVNAAYAQATGQTAVETALDLSDFCERGTAEIGADLREKFTGALLGVLTKNWYLDSSYRSQYSDPFFEDERQFGAITQMITVEVPEAKESSAWKTFTSGVSTVGQYTVYLPVVTTQLYCKSTSWAIPITITDEQWDTAFKSADELATFVGYIWLVMDNAIVQHLEDMNNANRNGFIAEKLNAANNLEDGIHVLDLVKMYCEDTGRTTAMTVEEFLNDYKALIFATEQIRLYIDYMKKQTALFNTAGKVHFIPENRLVVQLLGAFERRIESLESDVFHNEMIALPLHSTVPAWQSMADLSFDGVSSINVKIANPEGGDDITIEQGGIIGLICDKWCVVHTIRKNRIGVQRFDIESLTHYEHQFRDSYMINASLNGVVLVVNDYTPA